MNVFEMTEFQRIISVSDGRVTGSFQVLAPASRRESREFWVTTLDVTIWSADRGYGRTFHSDDLTVPVRAGEALLTERMIPENRLHDALDVWDELKATLVAVTQLPWRSLGPKLDPQAADARSEES